MAKKRHLTDLYVKGKLHTVDDGDGGVTVFLRKLNVLESEECVRYANAARSRVLAATRDPDSDIYRAATLEVEDSPRETLIDFLVAEPALKKRESVEAEVSHEEEWLKDDYYQGLNDAWIDGLAEKFQEDPDDEEAKRVHGELQRFNEEVVKRLEGEIENLKAEWERTSDKEVEEKAFEALIKARADAEWVESYRRAELYYAIRDDEDQSQYYFDKIDDVKHLATETLIDLLATVRDLAVEPQEGKDSEDQPSS